MAVKLRDDIVLEEVCGVNVLVALRSAWGVCPFAIKVGPTAAFFWRSLREGKNEEEMLAERQKTLGIDMEKLRRLYERFLVEAEKYHYLVMEEPET